MDMPTLEPVKARPVAWGGRRLHAMDGPALLRAMVDECLAQVLPNADAIANGSTDPEHVHQLRVGLRRLRSAVRAMAPFAAGLAPGWEPAIRPVFDALGTARDRHVGATTLAPRLRAAGAPLYEPPLEDDDGPAALRGLVRGLPFQQALLALMSFAETRDDVAQGEAGEGLAHVVACLRKLDRQLRRDAPRLDALPFARQHRARKRLKRLRYLAGFAAPAFAGADVKAWTKAASRAQDALGRHVDLVLAGERFAGLAATHPRAWFAAGWLRAKSARSARAARRALVRLRGVAVFW